MNRGVLYWTWIYLVRYLAVFGGTFCAFQLTLMLTKSLPAAFFAGSIALALPYKIFIHGRDILEIPHKILERLVLTWFFLHIVILLLFMSGVTGK